MNTKLKKALYESIMKSVAKTVKTTLNESKLQNPLFNELIKNETPEKFGKALIDKLYYIELALLYYINEIDGSADKEQLEIESTLDKLITRINKKFGANVNIDKLPNYDELS